MKKSLTFRVLSFLGVLSNEEKWGDISLWKAFRRTFYILFCLLAYKYCYSSFVLESLNFRKIRPMLWRKIGCKVGKGVRIGHSVVLDYGNANMITVEDYVAITDGCILLCHRRDLTNYQRGDCSWELPFVYKPIHIEQGVQLGKGCIIMPGVTIGEGTIIGAGSVVSKSIPAWSVAAGVPAKVLKTLS